MHDFRTRYGDWAVVAGASEGLGEAFATELAKRGMHLLLIARRAEVLRTVADRLRQDHGIDVVVSCAGAITTPRYLKSTSRIPPGTMTPDAVARETLDAVGNGPRVVPGALNRVFSLLFDRLLPRRTAIRLMAENTKDLT